MLPNLSNLVSKTSPTCVVTTSVPYSSCPLCFQPFVIKRSPDGRLLKEDNWELRKDDNGTPIPIVTLKCGHRFCRPCAEGIWNHARQCPLCNLDMQHNDILTIQEIQNMEQNSVEVEVVDEPEREYDNLLRAIRRYGPGYRRHDSELDSESEAEEDGEDDNRRRRVPRYGPLGFVGYRYL